MLDHAIAEVVDRPGEARTIDHFARAAAMSRAPFQRRFAVRTGTTVARLLDQTMSAGSTARLKTVPRTCAAWSEVSAVK